MKKVFITGGAGFIGRHLCRRFCSNGYHVTIFDNFSNSTRDDLIRDLSGKSNYSIIEGDIRDQDKLGHSLSADGSATLIHLAAQVSVQDSMQNPELNNDININGTQNVINASKNNSVEKIVFASSAAVYGSQRPPLAEDMVNHEQGDYENTLLSPYAVSKYKGEKAIVQSGLNYMILRIFNVYGIGQKTSGSYAAVIPEFIRRINQNNAPSVFGDGTQTRDFIFVEDVANAVKSAMDRSEVSGIFNLASGIGVSLLKLISIIENIVSRKININFQPERPGDIRESFADIGKLKRIIGFTPRITLEDGIKKLILN